MSTSHHSVQGTIALILEEQRRIDHVVHRRHVDVPPASRPLMVGPHPDDNLFGPGSTTIKYTPNASRSSRRSREPQKN